ncbi:uncharacterized protein [Henckelia pumila]|uniref:uncharacterized protein isoform X4 n=1 Tax=Henckelia pumila TaxID=405737 RepID=UPI003C6EA1E9
MYFMVFPEILGGLLNPSGGFLLVNKPRSFVFQNPDCQVALFSYHRSWAHLVIKQLNHSSSAILRRRVKLCGNYHFGLPFPLKSPRSAAASRRTRILFHSNGMPKREMNKTYYNNRSEGLNYCLVVFLPLIFKWFQSFQFSCLYYVGAMHGKISCVKKLIEAGDNAVFWLVVPRLIREARRK